MRARMARTYPGEFAELPHSDGLRKILLYVIQDQLETTCREPPETRGGGAESVE